MISKLQIKKKEEVYMAFLAEFLALSLPTEQKERALASPEFQEWMELRGHSDIMLERGYFTGEDNDLSDPEKRVLKAEERLLETIWKKYQFVPEEMEESALGEKRYSYNLINRCARNKAAKELVKFSNYPQIKLAEIREVADKLSLMVVPFCYLDRGRLEATVKEMERNHHCINTDLFEESISRIAPYTEQDLYVLCPASLYNLVQVERDKGRHEVIFGGELMQFKAVLDTIAQIQKNLFAILQGNEADTGIWEIGQGSGCSENELMHLKILVETIMPIQHGLLEIARKSGDMSVWEKTMHLNHYKEVTKVLQGISHQLSWSKEAEKALKKFHAKDIKDSKKASWVISEAVAMTNVMFFSLPHGTSLMYGDGLAKIFKCYSVDMPESFYRNRGFMKQSNGEIPYEVRSEIDLSL